MSDAVYSVPADRATYNFRYFLPYPGNGTAPALCRKRLRELLRFCRSTTIDAVQFYVNISRTVPGMPPETWEEELEWAGWMRTEVAPALRRAGISYQLNFQAFLGHGFTGLESTPPWELMINQQGLPGDGCACPLGRKFRQIMGPMLRLWAETDPDVMWIDDDFRMHNHRFHLDDNMDFYCFCPEHLQRFADRYGTVWEREALWRELVRPGQPSVWRERWLEFIAGTMTETAGWLRREVHAVSPRTRLAQMISHTDVHSMEGRDWPEFLAALSGPHRPLVRTCCGVYSSSIVPLKQNAMVCGLFGQAGALLRESCGDAVEFAPELENARFSTWSNAVSNSRFVLNAGQLAGYPHITLSLHDLEGNPLTEEPTNRPLLRQSRPRLEALAALRLAEWEPAGVTAITSTEVGKHLVHREAEAYDSMPPGRPVENLLLPLGTPLQWHTPSHLPGHGPVILESAMVWTLREDELRRVTAGAVLTDAEGAAALTERGFGAAIGVRPKILRTDVVAAESGDGGVLPGVPAWRMPHVGCRWHELELCGAQAASELIDYAGRRYPGTTCYENPAGGRVVVLANTGCEPLTEWANHGRMRNLHGLLRFLDPDCVYPVLPGHGVTICRRRKGEWLVAAANLTPDRWEGLTLRFPAGWRISGVRELRRAEWHDTEFRSLSPELRRVAGSIAPLEWKVLRFAVDAAKKTGGKGAL